MFLVMMFSYNVKFLTCDESVQLKNGDFKSYKYETKKRVEETVYDSGKRSFCERRGGNWSAVNPRQIKQLEAKFRERTAVYCDWLSDNLIVIVFSSGAIAYLTVKPNTLDVTQILFDRYVVGKLAAQTVSGVAFCKSHLLFTHTDRTATLVTFGKNSSTQPCRIRDRDPHIQAVELGGSRRTERRVSWCETGSGPRVLVWGAAAVEPAPWSPVLEDHANMHLYLIKGQHMSLIAYHQLENETLSAEISKNNDNVIHIVEQTSCHKTGVSLEWVRYELPDVEVRATKLSCVRQASTAAALAAPARAVRRSPCDLRLLAACIDGSLHIVHATAGLTHSTRIGFVATEVLWAGALTLACEEGGRLQCLDRALAPLPHPAVCLHLAAHLREPRRMRLLAAHGARAGPLALAACGGPLALLRIAHPDLITAWIRSGRPSAAVSLLRSLDWAASGAECLRATTALVSRALRTMDADGEALAQAALGAYLAPIAPHAPNAAKYAPAVHDLARKFFHHLLRRGRVEKALSLCVDLRARDLCCDARAAARRARLPALADEARALAAHLANGKLSLLVDLRARDLCCDARAAARRARLPALADEARALAAHLANGKLSLRVDLRARDLCCDARAAARRARLPALADEARALAAHLANGKLSLRVDLRARDLCCDARAAARRARLPALADEARALAAHLANGKLSLRVDLRARDLCCDARAAARRARLPALADEARALAAHLANGKLSLRVDLRARDLCCDARAAARRARLPALADEARALAAHLANGKLSLRVDLRARDLCCDARAAARRARLPALADEARALAAHLANGKLSLRVDLRARDLCCDARAAARRARLPALADEARALAAHLANESVCSESCSQCSSHSSGSEEAPPLPRAPPLPAAPAPTTSIRPNLHQYLEKNNTIWNTDVREPQRPLALSKQNKHVDVPRQDEKSAVHFRHLFQTELREDAPNGMYRYHYGQASGERTVKFDNAYDRQRPPEKNKVKFSDTVTIAVVASEPPCPTPARELADSLPLCAPHKYLAAFARAPPGTADYVEV